MLSALILKADMNVNASKDMRKLTHQIQKVNVKTSTNVSQVNFPAVQIHNASILMVDLHAYVMKDSLVMPTLVANHLVMV